MDFPDDFRDWAEEELANEFPPSLEAFHFNLYEVHGGRYAFDLIGATGFDPSDPDWPCNEVWEADPRLIVLPRSFTGSTWETCLTRFHAFIKTEFAESRLWTERMKTSRAVGVGFVDGDSHLAWLDFMRPTGAETSDGILWLELAARSEQHNLLGSLSAIRGLCRKCVLFGASENEDYRSLGSHRLGGLPDLPVGVEWPVLEGQRLAFLCQIDLSDPALAGSPIAGAAWLYVFKGDNEEGVELEVIHSTGKRGDLRSAIQPPALPFRGSQHQELNGFRVDLIRSVSLPGSLDPAVAQAITDPRALDRYDEMRSALCTRAGLDHQLLGYPWTVTPETPLDLVGSEGKRPLLQLNFAKAVGISSFDAGVLSVYADPADGSWFSGAFATFDSM